MGECHGNNRAFLTCLLTYWSMDKTQVQSFPNLRVKHLIALNFNIMGLLSRGKSRAYHTIVARAILHFHL